MTAKEMNLSEMLFNRDNKLLDYITNLQQEKSDICKNRLAIAIERDRLQQENERLKFENGNLKTNEQINVEVHNKQVEIIKDYKSRCDNANDFIDNYDVFKEFSFPLMKRDIENQIKSSIDYEFNSTFRKKLKNILNGSDEK